MKPIFLPALFAGVLGATHVLAADNTGASFLERWDVNNDGAVSLEEAEKRRQALFAKLDTNKDGFLDSDEFTVGAETGADSGSEDTSLLMGLDLNDVDGDGKVSAGEFMSNSGTWVDLMDENKDGAISAEEFQTKWHDRDARIKLR
ncbi:hypothetical protein J7481_04820 [Labrenzia sp. R4_2]|uniref:EF-hand domain-containing protein n=1 Tax=Labrenzia sp. R4_2 TaxID=2821107 RepID=UPI001ADC8E05|nr:EF-hand domain-containing protein [Labrenzia sp. R4_2]MBO9418811.1 hypothetical protein [Labrenzia sp. R4_2]